MNVLWILIPSTVALLLAGRFYSRFVGRILGEDPTRTTPALAINDGRDFVPSKTPVVFAHHFASIAGAAPIIGPTLALLYGWGPAILWIVLAGIFMGAVHDYAAAHISIREGGRSLAVVARRTIGNGCFVLVTFLLIALLAIVCAAFLDLSATALTSMVPLSELHLESGKHIFRETTTTADGQLLSGPHAIIGGVASMSVIIITACSPLIGFLYLKKKVPVWTCSLLALVICTISILIGLKHPVAVSPATWKFIISAYVLIAAGLPVWLFLQSRDFINVHILYVGIAFLFVSVVAAGLRGQAGSIADMPMDNVTEGTTRLGPIWPVLMVTIACGAISGFHSLAASGTTAKQLTSETAARRVGYFGMLLESFLAVCVVCCLAVGLSLDAYKGYLYPIVGKGNAVLTFGMAVGYTANRGLGLPIAFGDLGAMLMLEGFLVTTLDTAIRLTRYLLEEAFSAMLNPHLTNAPVHTGTLPTTGSHLPTPTSRSPRFARLLTPLLQHYWLNSAIAVGLMLALALTNSYKAMWGVFGATNQLWAAIGLVIASVWLRRHGRTMWITAVPALIMLATTLTMLLRLLILKYIPAWPKSLPLLTADLVILALTAGVFATSARSLLKMRRGAATPASEPASHLPN